ncbi:MAG: glycine cleavage system protein GcvH [Pseudomonadota bacterium]
MRFPEDLLYSLDHLWLRDQGAGRLVVGLTAYAQERLGRAVFVELPEVGDPLLRDVDFGMMKSARALADLISPVNGEAVLVNQALADSPGLVNDDPYGRGWLLAARLHSGLPPGLMDATQYESQLGLIPFERPISG